VEDLLVEGNRVATLFTSTGTHRGAFLGIPATGRRVRIGEASVFHLEGGRIAEQWAYSDVGALEQQLSAEGTGQDAPGP
jgi:predicted ester cyclase